MNEKNTLEGLNDDATCTYSGRSRICEPYGQVCGGGGLCQRVKGEGK